MEFQEAYLKTADDVLRELHVRPDKGLHGPTIGKRRKEWGENVLPRGHGRSPVMIFLDRFKDILIIVLLFAAGISIALGRMGDAVIISIAILVDSFLSFAQVWRTERTLKKIREHVQPVATLFRNGRVQSIPAKEIVKGDIIEVRAGERIPADARLFQSQGMRVRESSLTGESDDVEKVTHKLETRTPVSSRRNMLFMGTSVVGGSGRAVVTEIGTRTEFGKIAQLLKTEASPISPLAKKLQKVGLQIGAGVIIAVLAIFIVGLLNGQNVQDTLFTSITLVVSAIPEDLTMILTIALTIGVARILRQKGVVRDLRSGETLGAATVICTDKTGTLTEGRMTATGFNYLQGSMIGVGEKAKDPLKELALAGLALASDAHRIQGTDEYIGSGTEKAAVEFADKAGVIQTTLRKNWGFRDSLPFNSKWKYRATLYDHPTQATKYLFATGAPEVLLERSSRVLNERGDVVDITSSKRYSLLRKTEELAGSGKRLLAVGLKRNINNTSIEHSDVKDLLFLGVLVIEDPIREGVVKSVAETLAAGVEVKLVTGDHPYTARAVARDIGLSVPEETIITSEIIERMSDVELQSTVETTRVFARITPIDKQRIVKALQSKGHVVAMTGDGINDAVALRGADIGVAMGSGKDIAREAADLVLLDDRFQTIVAAIKEGRVIRDNIRKVIAFLLSTNMAEVAIFIVSLLLRLPLPMLPAQILWVNLVTDGTSDIALSLEPAERDIMRRKPDDPKASLLSRYNYWQMFYRGMVMTTIAMSLYWYLFRHLSTDIDYVRTMIFTFISISSLISVWSFRSLKESMFSRGFLGNPWVPVSMTISATMQILAVYLPGLQSFFGTVPLRMADWILILGLSILTLFAIDAYKIFLGQYAGKQRVKQAA